MDLQLVNLDLVKFNSLDLVKFQNKWQDKIRTTTLLEKQKMLTVNQINAQIKLSETWKAVNDEDHPYGIVKPSLDPNDR